MMTFNARAAGLVHAICMQRPAARNAGAPRRARRSRARARLVAPRWAGNWLSQPPLPRPSPQVTSETLPYCILRRMSTDDYSAAPLEASAVIVDGLVGVL